MRAVFMGTPEASAVALRALADAHEVVCVYTRPDSPAGRGLELRASPVKEAALERGLRVHQPRTLRDPAEHELLRELEPDVVVVVAYGQILPPEVLAVPRLGCVNVHFSLLPRWRGAAPVERAIMSGDKVTGVTTMLMDEGLDTGPILLQARERILPDDTGGSLLARLASCGAELLHRTLDGLGSREIEPRTQPDVAATYARKVGPQDAELVFATQATRLVDIVRALSPDPGAFTWYRGRRLKVWRTRAIPGSGHAGVIAAVSDEGPDVQTADGRLRLLEVQPEGKRAMSGEEFVRGYRPAVREPVGAEAGPAGA